MNFPSQPESVLWIELLSSQGRIYRLQLCASALQSPPGGMQTFTKTLAHMLFPGLLPVAHTIPTQQSVGTFRGTTPQLQWRDIRDPLSLYTYTLWHLHNDKISRQCSSQKGHFIKCHMTMYTEFCASADNRADSLSPRAQQ